MNNYDGNFVIFSSYSLDQLDAIAQSCDSTDIKETIRQIFIWMHFSEEKWNSSTLESSESICEILKIIAPNQATTILNAHWNSNNRKVEFKPIFTEKGLCYTFNSINSHEMFTNE